MIKGTNGFRRKVLRRVGGALVVAVRLGNSNVWQILRERPAMYGAR